MKRTPKLAKVIRLDSIPLSKAYYTEEGYLRDNPILTTTGIFEYHNPDGSIRRELRLPEEVFDEKSLKSYKGKPIIITHDAGLIDKDNVYEEQIGTILSEGKEDGENVRAEIVIHDTDEMKECGLKELSLGYNLELDETPGIWNGEPYDAIQRNIEINHLALVREARAGDNARLNIDSRDGNILKGGALKMAKKTKKHATKRTKAAKHNDSVLSKEELAQAIADYKARRANRLASQAADDDETTQDVISTVEEDDDDVITSSDIQNAETPEEKVELIKDRRDRRDSEGDPETVEEATGIIANQDEEIDVLFDIIDTLLAEKEFDEAEECNEDDDEILASDDEDDIETSEPFGENTDDDLAPEEDDFSNDDDDIVVTEEDDEDFIDGEDDDIVSEDEDDEEPTVSSEMNADSVDSIVRTRIQLGMVGRQLNMDGLENMSIKKAKKAVIKRVRPDMRLDGKSDAYINGAYNLAVKEITSRSKKDVNFQKKQMFNMDGRRTSAKRTDSSDAARQRMIQRQRSRKSN